MTEPAHPSAATADPVTLLADLCVARLEATDRFDVLRTLGASAVRAGYARPSFVDALVERERTYPTALPTPIPVALPHTDPAFVTAPGLILATLAHPIPFGVMGTASGAADVPLVALLLMHDGDDHVDLVADLIDLLGREPVAASLCAAPDRPSLVATARTVLGVTA